MANTMTAAVDTEPDLDCQCDCHLDGDHCTSCCTYSDIDGLCEDCRFFRDAENR